MKSAPADVQLIPLDRIRVVNPRAREPKKFEQIVQNIEAVGLKRPITVTRPPGAKAGEEAYDLICGQGRMEAFRALGQTHIPAFVRGFSREQGLLASLIENVARRRVRAIEQIQAIRWMHEQKQSPADIGRKTGLAEKYVKDILGLLDRGEERLLDAALAGRIPITVATKISETRDEDVQSLLMQAYEKKEVNQKSLGALRRLIQLRKSLGRDYRGKPLTRKRRSSVDGFVASFRAQTEKQRLLIRKARSCEARLLALTAAFRALLADENFRTLLRAEKLNELPAVLADRLKKSA